MLNFHVEQPSISGVLTLEGEMNVQHAGELKAALMNSLDNVSQVTVNLEKTTAIDLSCLQLLCSAQYTSLKDTKRLTMTGYSQPFIQAISDSGYGYVKNCVFECKESCLWKEIVDG